MTDQRKNDELITLLEKYDRMELSGDERNRLITIVSSTEGRKAVLYSKYPEAVFLAGEEEELPQWDTYWNGFRTRLDEERTTVNFGWKWARLIGTAAMIVIAVFIALPMYMQISPEEEMTAPDQLADMTYKLKYRLPAEVLSQIKDFMSEDSSIEIDAPAGEIHINDYPGNIENLRRTLSLIDRQPIELNFNLKLLAVNDSKTLAIERVDATPSDEIDLNKYEIRQDLEIRPTENRQFRQVLEDRYEITCFVQLNPEATEAKIVNMSVYDLVERKIVVRKGNFRLAEGWSKMLKTDLVDDEGKPLLVTISLTSKN